MCFDLTGLIGNNWQRVGSGWSGSTKLAYIKETNSGPVSNLYLGVIFDSYNDQLGFAATEVEATISAPSAILPPVEAAAIVR